MARIEKYNKNDIMTHTGRIFDPWKMGTGDVDIRDIAHALALITRANGHMSHFYSVAQHSINCALEAQARGLSERVQLACLTHDAGECYVADVPRPVKHRLAGYAELEEQILQIVWQALGLGDLSEAEKQAVFEIDDAMLYFEFLTLKNALLRAEQPMIRLEHDFSLRDMAEVEAQFLAMHEQLSGSAKNA